MFTYTLINTMVKHNKKNFNGYRISETIGIENLNAELDNPFETTETGNTGKLT